MFKLGSVRIASLVGCAVIITAYSQAVSASVFPAPAPQVVSQLSMPLSVSLAPLKDNTLYQSTTGSLSNGAGAHFFAGKTNAGLARRAVLAFDVASAIPEGSTILTATLTLNMSQTNPMAGAQTISLQRLSTDWGEGTSNASMNEGQGASATTNDATWLHTFFNSSFWASSGGDFQSTASASLAVNQVGSYTWGSSAGMVADVQSWLDTPAANYGWLLMGNEAVNLTTKRFDSRENATLANRPVLTIHYLSSVIYTHPTDPNCGGNTPCLSGSTAIQDALDGLVDGGTVVVAGDHSLSSPLSTGNSGANAAIIQGSPGTLGGTLDWGGTSNGFSVGTGDLTVKGLVLTNTLTVFDQTGGALSAYANNIAGWASPFSGPGTGTADLGHNWWGNGAHDAPDPGLPSGDWARRLGAEVAFWSDGSGSVTLGDAGLSGGNGTAVIVSFGRGSANAPFGNGITPHVDNMCSDYFDFFVRNATGLWEVSVPVDDTTDCNNNTLAADALFYVPDISECASTNSACWDLAPNRSNSGQNLLSSNLLPAQLGGTLFVAGDNTGRDPTAIRLVGLTARTTDNPSSLGLVMLAALGTLVLNGLGIRKRSRNLPPTNHQD